MRDRVGPWRREPGIDYIMGDGSAEAAYGYDHDNGEVSFWLIKRDVNTWDFYASSTHTNEMWIARDVSASSREAKQAAYEWMRKNADWERRERPQWLMDMNDAGGGTRHDPRDMFDDLF